MKAGLALFVLLTSCVDKPEIVAAHRSPDGRLIARLVHTSAGPTVSHLTLDVGVANDGPFTTVADLSEWSDAFPLRWSGPATVEANLPCATTRLRGTLQQQVTLPETRGAITVKLTRPSRCKLPVMRLQ